MAHWTKLQLQAIGRLREAVRNHNLHEKMPQGVIISRVRYAGEVCKRVGVPGVDIDRVITEELEKPNDE